MSKSTQSNRYDISSRVHIIILYLLIACLTICWAVYFIYFSRLIRVQIKELNFVKQRLDDLAAAQITITSSNNGDEASQRLLRHARTKSKLWSKQEKEDESDALFGSIHFKVPVREKS